MKSKIPLDLGKLEKLYLEERKSSREVGEILGVSSETVLRRLREWGKNRTRSQSLQGDLNPFYGKRHTEKTKRFLREKILKQKLWEYEKHWSLESRQAMSKKAKEIGFRPPSRFGVPHTLESRLKISLALRGPNSYLWKGGSNDYRGEDWFWMRKQCYERDNWDCQLCGKHGGELCAHHIVSYSESYDNSLENLITLCLACHRRIHNWC